MHLPYTNLAMNAGGKITITQPIPGKRIFLARLEQDFEEPAQGLISMSVEGALMNLEEQLVRECKEILEG